MSVIMGGVTERLSTVILTYRRDEALRRTLTRLLEVLGPDGSQVVLVDNNADDIDRGVLLEPFRDGTYIRQPVNTGVAEGRNRGIAASSGDVLLFLDDDALVVGGPEFSKDLLGMFTGDPSLACVAFRSHVGGETEDPAEFPHTDKGRPRDVGFDTFRFIGVAHALRRTALSRAGRYCESFFYGMEEFDLSYRLLKLGYRIAYVPRFRVHHMKDDRGRLPAPAVVRRMYANKLAVGWMHLPWPTFIVSAGAWFVKTALDSRSPLTAVRAIGDFVAMVSHGQVNKRDPSTTLVKQIRHLGGTPWR
mgnify:CR=1 FL=1